MNSRIRRDSDQSVEKAAVFPRACAIQAAQEMDLAHGDNTREKQGLGPIGTARASNLSPSVASSPARRWGGKRNSASRTSDSLSLEQAAKIMEAAQFAASAGMPFNRHITIHWQQAGIADERAAWATGRFLKLAGDWLGKCVALEFNQSKSERFAWVWVREYDAVSEPLYARKGKGSHVHILLHLPAGARIGRMQRRWLRSITGQPYSANTIRTARIGGTACAAETVPGTYQANLAAVVGYILKGTSPAAIGELGLERLEAGGRIVGKRAATSQNVGRAARREASW